MIPEKAFEAAWMKLAEVMDCDPESRGMYELGLIDGLRAALEAALPYLAEPARHQSSTDWPDIPRSPK